jgi:hypothetical protein
LGCRRTRTIPWQVSADGCRRAAEPANRVHHSDRHPLQITPQYAQERGQWCITPCSGCGSDQTLDPMTTMAKTRFPDAPGDSIPIAFSAFCPCGGTMMLAMADVPHASASTPTSGGSAKPWWRFW